MEEIPKKTIFILTTRSFQKDTLFNPDNCRPVEFKKNTVWYKSAFPQYFTDVIHFLDLSALQTQVESYILQQLPIHLQKILDLENEVERATRKHFKIYLKKEEKKKETSNKSDRKEFAEKLQQVLAEVALKKPAIAGNVKKEIKRIIEQLQTKTLKNILINKSEEKTELILEKEICTHSYRYSTVWEVEENIAIDIATAKAIAALLEVIPCWWFALLKNKNKYCYLNYEDAYSCYMFIQTHASRLLEKCDEAHRQSNKNEFSLHNLIYKYPLEETDATTEDWYIVKCFGMRTDPDLGLTYIISLIKEIESHYPKTIDLSFNILIHDYDIGRKLIHNSVGLMLQTPILKQIQKSFAEKNIESTLENQQKIMLSPRQLQKYYGKQKFLLSLNAILKLPFEYTNNSSNERYKTIEYIRQNQESLKKTQRIIVFKHNKGEVAELLKTGFVYLLKYFIFHKQAILDMQYELIEKTDNLTVAYNHNKIKSLIPAIKLTLKMIEKAEKVLKMRKNAEETLKMIESAEKVLKIYGPLSNREYLYIIKEKNYLAKTKEDMAGLLAYVENIRKDNFGPAEIISNIKIISTFFQS